MATVQTMCNRAIRMLGKLASNTTLSSDESADCLVALNDLIDDLRNDKLLCYAYQNETLTLTTASSYTIGPSGDLNTTRPVEIVDFVPISGGFSYPSDTEILSDEEYDAIPDKAATSTWPTKINYRPTMPTGTLYVYPVPTGAGPTLSLLTRVVVAEFTALTDTVSLPPGWRQFLTTNLAVAMAPEYENVSPSTFQLVVQAANNSRANLKRINSRPIKAYTDLTPMFGRRNHNIIIGQ